jgi:hypothetical protein
LHFSFSACHHSSLHSKHQANDDLKLLKKYIRYRYFEGENEYADSEVNPTYNLNLRMKMHSTKQSVDGGTVTITNLDHQQAKDGIRHELLFRNHQLSKHTVFNAVSKS